MKRIIPIVVVALPILAARTQAQAPAKAPAPSNTQASAFTYLDDDAEAGGYDVTAHITTPTAELSLAEAANGDGYRLKVTPTALELDAEVNKKAEELALVKIKLTPGDLVLQRRGPRWRVLSGNRIVLEAEDDRWREGKIGYIGGLSDVRVQPTDTINFADDFMRDAKAVLVKQAVNDESLWRAAIGTWGTSGLTENQAAQVSQTANPFVFKTSAPGPHLALAGQAFWSDYTAEVSVKPDDADAIGMAVDVQDDKNYLFFHWDADGPMQLRAVVNGQTRVLDQAPGGFDQKQWYRLKFTAASGMLRAYVDDNEVLRARTGLFARGQIGLFAQTAGKDDVALFDDVAVRSENDFLDDFEQTIPGRWQNVSGTWAMNGAATPRGTGGAFAVMGESDWSDYIVSADISLPATASAGLVLHHQKGQGAYWLRLAGSHTHLPYAGKAQIVKLQNGVTTILGETKIGSRYDGKTTHWSFSSERGYLRGDESDDLVVDGFDDNSNQGRAGISAQSGTTGTGKHIKLAVPAISNFEVKFPQPHPTWAKVPDLYTEGAQPITMGGWSRPEGFWLTNSQRTGTLVEQGSAAPLPGETLWHKGRFWGDDSVKFNLPVIPDGKSVDLMFAAVPMKGAAADPDTALKLSFKQNADNIVCELYDRGPAPIKTNQVKFSGALTDQSIEVERRGSFIIARTGGKDGKMSTLLAARVR